MIGPSSHAHKREYWPKAASEAPNRYTGASGTLGFLADSAVVFVMDSSPARAPLAADSIFCQTWLEPDLSTGRQVVSTGIWHTLWIVHESHSLQIKNLQASEIRSPSKACRHRSEAHWGNCSACMREEKIVCVSVSMRTIDTWSASYWKHVYKCWDERNPATTEVPFQPHYSSAEWSSDSLKRMLSCCVHMKYVIKMYLKTWHEGEENQRQMWNTRKCGE